MDPSLLAVATAFIAILVYRFFRTIVPPGTSLPPGPKGLPIVGNLYDVPHEHSWLTYAHWGALYGDIIYLEVFGSPLIIVNSAKVANDLFELRSSNYADRPRMVLSLSSHLIIFDLYSLCSIVEGHV